jgi:UDP-N-acetylglucosamine--N-acetylmuramyl-(pentapeptide) pyrophosphoryl-undecaprenol N-acetylglucosamine transferase
MGDDSNTSESSRKRIARLEREINRLRLSPSLRLGEHITRAMRFPWRAPFLIVTLPILMLTIGFEMLGRRKVKVSKEISRYNLVNTRKNTVIMFPTNGIGFGHFTRMLATANRMKKLDPDLEIIFFTTMPTLHILKEYGFPSHHVSGVNYFKHLNSSKWNALIEEELVICLETHSPSMFIFDGAFPYRGMLRAISAFDGLDKVWMRRGTFKQGANIPVGSISHFDLIIHPEDSVHRDAPEMDHGVESIGCPPIVLLEEDELMSKESARRRLGLPLDSIVVYVQLGAGEINNIQSEIRMTIDALMNHQNVHAVLGESMLGSRLSVNLERVHLLRDYPNSMYYNAFDATIQAGGYNSFHEVRKFQIPTLFYPNLNTGMDDQLTRCKAAIEEGWGIVLEHREAHSIKSSVDDLLENYENLEAKLTDNTDNMLLAVNLIARVNEKVANLPEEE